ncbi:MAG: hypothetical protein AABZ74_04020 [Cyanobacteriota bacterium]
MLVQKTEYGLEIKLHDRMSLDDLKIMGSQIEPIFLEYKSQNKKFSILLDLSEVQRQDPSVMEEMGKGMILAKEAGVEKTALIFGSSIAKLQMASKARESGVYHLERYFSITDDNYKEKALNWVKNGIDT